MVARVEQLAVRERGLVERESKVERERFRSTELERSKGQLELQMAQQTFVITDPLLPDNPIVFASQGFLTLTGYSLDQVL